MLENNVGFPPGHFYSPVPSVEEIRKREDFIFAPWPQTIPGVPLRGSAQLELFTRLAGYYGENPFSEHETGERRFYFENPNFRYGEAIILYSMIRHLAPRRIIEVGSGYSSAAILDTNELFFDGEIECLFIEPNPDLLRSLAGVSAHELNLIARPVQEVETESFLTLGENDILFVDSTHVSKVDSDVNHLFFRILPALAPGVYVHFHDIYYPFEYPREWMYERRFWNEAYLLRAFLYGSGEFRIEFFNSFFAAFYPQEVREKMPICSARGMGSSLWLAKCDPGPRVDGEPEARA